MKRIYVAQDVWCLVVVRAELERAGVPHLVRNEYLMGAAGELPPSVCQPEIWVVDAVDYACGLQVVAGALACAKGGSPWSCPACNESLEGQFGVCWRCGALRSLADVPNSQR